MAVPSVLTKDSICAISRPRRTSTFCGQQRAQEARSHEGQADSGIENCILKLYILLTNAIAIPEEARPRNKKPHFH